MRHFVAKRCGHRPPPPFELPCGNRDIASTNNCGASVWAGVKAYKYGGIVEHGIKRPAARQSGKAGVALRIPPNVLLYNVQSQLEGRYLACVRIG
jgi:hypothetical protein